MDMVKMPKPQFTNNSCSAREQNSLRVKTGFEFGMKVKLSGEAS